MRTTILFLALIGCKGDGDTDTTDVDNVTPVCDRVKQEDEPTTDGPFDADGDGFFDADDPNCALNYQPNQLDCDDSNPDINPSQFELPCNGVDDDCREASPESPDSDGDGVGACDDCNDQNAAAYPGAEEVCFDDIDNDCDSITDNDCGEDYAGNWTMSHPAALNCGLFGIPVVSVNMQEFFVLWEPPLMSVGQVTGASPPLFEGDVGEDGSISFSVTEGVFGDCLRDWGFQGTFTSDSTFEGSVTLDMNGPLVCGDCLFSNNQVWEFSATKD